jgi:16S rRNA processing protein RimM
MAYKTDILLGRITKISGYEGAVTVKLEKSFTENIPPMESVFIEIDGRPVPFFISEMDYSGADILRLTFDGYNSIERVSGFAGCRVFLTSGRSNQVPESDRDDLTGYSVLLPDSAPLGKITGIIQNPGQWLLVVTSPGGKEILIPFHEDLIKNIDNRKKNIVIDLPEGLIDLN